MNCLVRILMLVKIDQQMINNVTYGSMVSMIILHALIYYYEI